MAKPRRRDANYLAVLIDGAFYFTAMTFVAAATVIPTFAKELGASPLVIGLAPMLANMGWMLPQLFSARYVQQLTRHRPYVLTMMGSQRLCFLLIAILCWLIPVAKTKTLLLAFLGIYLLSHMLDGIGSVAWLEFVAAAIPERTRGTLFASRTFISCLTGLAAGWLTSLTLARFAFPANFGFLFLWAFLLFATGWTIFAHLSWEEPRKLPLEPSPSLADYLGRIPMILRNDIPFRGYVVGSMLLLFGQIGLAFFSVYSLERMALPPSYVGYLSMSMTTGQLLAAMFAGRLADAQGHKINLQLSCTAMGLAALITLLPANMTLTLLIFTLMGIANTTYGVSRLPIVMEYATEGYRSVYAGIVNTLLAPVVLITPIIGGRLVEASGYKTLFATALIVNAMAIWVFFTRVQDPRNLHKQAQVFSETL